MTMNIANFVGKKLQICKILKKNMFQKDIVFLIRKQDKQIGYAKNVLMILKMNLTSK